MRIPHLPLVLMGLQIICTLDNCKLQEAYKIFACNGILFNHESPRRGETFVTKKIVSALCKIKEGK